MNHPAEATQFVGNSQRAHWHDGALWFVRTKRDKAAGTLPEGEELRALAARIKAHTISRLGEDLPFST